MAIELAHGYVSLTPSLRGAQKQIESQLAGVDTSGAGSKIGEQLSSGLGRSLDFSAVGQRFQDVGKNIADVGGKLTKYITGPALVAATAVGGITAALGWRRLVSLDTAQAQLRGLGYEAEDVERISAQLTVALEGGMMTMAEATSAAATAMAAGVQEGDELTRYIQLLDAAVVGGTGSFQEMEQIFGRVVDQGYLTRTEFDMIAQRMPGFSAAVQEGLGVSSEAMYDMLRDGEVTTAQFLDVMDDFAGDMATEYAKSWEGMVQNTKAWVGIIGETLLGGVFEQSKESIAEFEEWLQTDEVQAWAQEAGQAIGEAFGKIVEAVQGAIEWWTGLDDSTKGLILTFAGIAVVVGPVVLILGKIIIAIGAVIKAVGVVAGAFAFLANPITWIVVGIAALIAGLIALIANWDTVVAWLSDVWAGMVDWLTEIWNGLVATVTDVWNSITEAVGAAVDAVLAWITSTWDSIVAKVTGALDSAKSTISSAWEWIKTATQNAWNAVVDFVMAPINRVRDAVSNLGSNVRTSIANAWNTVRNLTSTAWTNVRTAVVNGISNVVSTIAGLPGRALSALGNIGSTLMSAGSDMISGFIRGIRNMAGNVISAITSTITNALPNFVKRALGIRSPSRLFAGLGADVMAGFAQGLSSGGGDVLDEMDAVVADLTRAPQVDLTARGGLGPVGRMAPASAADGRGITNNIYETTDARSTAEQVARRLALAGV